MKNEYQLGLETILNNPKTSFLKNPGMLDEISKSSGMSMSQMIKSVGKTAKSQKNKKKEPTDEERSLTRLETMGKTQ